MSTPPPLTVVCPSCSTKFSVADHIIRGKYVKFRCKKCQGTIECDGRALSAQPPPVRPARQSNAPPRTSEPPMRLSISDGLQFDAGTSLAPPKVPQLGAPPAVIAEAPANRPRARQPSSPGDLRDDRRPSDPFGLRRSPAADPQLAAPLFTGPPTSVSQSRDLAKLQTIDTPADGHTTSDHPGPAQEGGGKSWRRWGLALLVAAAGAGGWILARQSGTTSASAPLSAAAPAAPEPKPAAVDTGKAVSAELVRPAADTTKPVETTSAIEPAKAVAPGAAPQKVIDPTASPVLRVAPVRTVVKAEAPAGAAPAAPAEVPAEAPAPGAEEAAAMAAVPDQHEFNKAAARSALEDAADHATSCRNVDTPAGAARVAVTFAPSGKVTSAIIESGPFVGTASGGCVASKFRNLHIPAFTSDEPVTVHKTITF
jgi:predicted Zn finger-like uncharacterized protein